MKKGEALNMNKKTDLRKLVYAAVCLALCLVLPFLTGQNRQLGNMLSLMHIPVFLAGFLCGPWWALAVGALAPVLRHFLMGMPPFPTYVAMALELAAYGLVTGLLYKALPKKPQYVYITLIAAMLVGRLVSGLANVAIYGLGLAEGTYTVQTFLAAHFLTAWPGIVLHIVLIPLLVLALRRAKVIRG